MMCVLCCVNFRTKLEMYHKIKTDVNSTEEPKDQRPQITGNDNCRASVLFSKDSVSNQIGENI